MLLLLLLLLMLLVSISVFLLQGSVQHILYRTVCERDLWFTESAYLFVTLTLISSLIQLKRDDVDYMVVGAGLVVWWWLSLG